MTSTPKYSAYATASFADGIPIRRDGYTAKRALQEIGYVLRCYFNTRAMQAESKGLLRDWRTYFMGHKGDIEHTYSLNKGQLPGDLVEQMREGYEAALEFLETTPPRAEEDPTLKMLRVFLQAAGYTEEEIDTLDLEMKTEDEIVALLQKAPRRLMVNGNGSKQRMVDLEELPTFLENGWIFKSSLPDGRVIVETAVL